MNNEEIYNTLNAWLYKEMSLTKQEIVKILHSSLNAWEYKGMDLTKEDIVAMRKQWEAIKFDTPEFLQNRIDKKFAHIAHIQAPKSFASHDNLECFVHDVNEALERFAPEFLRGTYKKVKSQYVYEKDDLKISAKHIYEGIYVLVIWKEGEYISSDIQGAVSKWAEDYHYHE